MRGHSKILDRGLRSVIIIFSQCTSLRLIIASLFLIITWFELFDITCITNIYGVKSLAAAPEYSVKLTVTQGNKFSITWFFLKQGFFSLTCLHFSCIKLFFQAVPEKRSIILNRGLRPSHLNLKTCHILVSLHVFHTSVPLSILNFIESSRTVS